MNVAQVRGVIFNHDHDHPEWLPDHGWTGRAQAALEDVAKALGFINVDAYNITCVNDPAEVERLLEAL
jgi:hypothetical protein